MSLKNFHSCLWEKTPQLIEMQDWKTKNLLIFFCMYDKIYQHFCKSLKDTSDLTRVTIMGHIPYLFSEKSRDSISPFILSLVSFLSFSPTSFSLLNRSRSFIYCFIPSFFPSFKQGQVLNFKISFKMVPRHPLGPRTERCCHLSPCQRGSPWSPALFSSPAPQEPAARSLPRTLASGTLPQGLRPFPLSQGPPLPFPALPSSPGSQLAERIYLHISTFVPRRRPISARGEAGVWAGLGLRLRLQLLRPQVPERVGTAAGAPRAAAPSQAPGSPPRPRCCVASARPRRQGQRGCLEAPPEPDFTCSCREPQAPRWFAGASRVPRTACARSTYSTP